MVMGLAFLLGWSLWLFGAATPELDNLPALVREKTAEQPFMWILVLLPLVVLPRLLQPALIAVRGDSFTFNALSRDISRNGKALATFAEVKAVQIRALGEQEYRVSLLLQGDGKVALGQADYEEICGLADAIADLTGTRVLKKD